MTQHKISRPTLSPLSYRTTAQYSPRLPAAVEFARKVRRGQQAQPGRKDLQDQPAHAGHKVRADCRALKATKALQARQDQLGHAVLPDLRGLPVQRD